MSTPILLQSVASSVVVYLELTETGLGAEGLTHADVTAGIKKTGDASFSTFVLDTTNFTELDEGYYELDLTAADTGTLGNLYLRFSGSDIKASLLSARVIVAEEQAAVPAPTEVETTAMFGYVYGAGGSPRQNISVSARILTQPTIVPTGVALLPEVVATVTDAAGYFELELVTGQMVDVSIPALNYRRTFVVPASSANIFTLE